MQQVMHIAKLLLTLVNQAKLTDYAGAHLAQVRIQLLMTSYHGSRLLENFSVQNSQDLALQKRRGLPCLGLHLGRGASNPGPPPFALATCATDTWDVPVGDPQPFKAPMFVSNTSDLWSTMFAVYEHLPF